MEIIDTEKEAICITSVLQQAAFSVHMDSKYEDIGLSPGEVRKLKEANKKSHEGFSIV